MDDSQLESGRPPIVADADPTSRPWVLRSYWLEAALTTLLGVLLAVR